MLKVTNRISRPIRVEGVTVPAKSFRTIDTHKTDRIKDLIKAGMISVSNVPSPQQVINKKRAQQPAPVIINNNNKKNKSQEEKSEKPSDKKPEDDKNLKKES